MKKIKETEIIIGKCSNCHSSRILYSKRKLCDYCRKNKEVLKKHPPKTNTIKRSILSVLKDKETITKSELVVRCWKSDKKRFGLAGYENEYPDSNRIISEIYGRRGLVDCGILTKISPNVFYVKLFHIEDEVYNEEQKIEKHKQVISEYTVKEKELLRVFQTTAYNKWRDNKIKDISLLESMELWGIKEEMNSEQVENKVSDFERLVNLFDSDNITNELLDKLLQSINRKREEIRCLYNLSDYLYDKYRKKLECF